MTSGAPGATDARVPFLAFMAVASVAFFAGLGDAPIERAEIYFLDGARGMVETGDWLVPHYRGAEFYDKPPLMYWLIAASFDAFGFSLAAGRFVPAVLALLTLGATFVFVRRHAGLAPGAASRAALFATVVLGTSYAFVSFARLTMSDMLLTLLVTVAADLFLRGDAAAQRSARSAPLALAGVALGLAFLAKGPIAWIFFGCLMLTVAIVERRRPGIFNVPGAIGTLLALAIGGSWFLILYVREGAEPLRWFFLRENLQRFAAATYDSERGVWYYLPTYLAEGLPWSALAIPAVAGAVRGSAAFPRTLVVWAGLMLVPLSLSRGKIDYYLLPLMPPLAGAIGILLATGAPRWALRLSAGSLAALLGLAAIFPGLPAGFTPAALVLASIRFLAAVMALGAAFVAVRPSAERLVHATAVSILFLAVAVFGAIVPAFRSGQPVAAILEDVAREKRFNPRARVVACDDTLRVQRDLLFELREVVIERCDLWRAITTDDVLILAAAHEESSLRRSGSIRHVATYDHLKADVASFDSLVADLKPATIALLANFTTLDPVARRKENREYKRAIAAAEAAEAAQTQATATPSPSR